jgi:hypothetical protein
MRLLRRVAGAGGAKLVVRCHSAKKSTGATTSAMSAVAMSNERNVVFAFQRRRAVTRVQRQEEMRMALISSPVVLNVCGR